MATPVTVIILAYNEEQNLPQALASVCGWAEQVIVLDSFSTDRTPEIAREFGCDLFQNKFENYAKQRNYALQLPIRSEWVFFLDSDEWLPGALKEEISQIIQSNPLENGFYVKRRFIWMDCWIRHGYYPTWILRLFRFGKGRCEERSVNEHIIVEGRVGFLKNDFFHQDRKGISYWIEKHNRYATLEAEELLKAKIRNIHQEEITASFWGSQAERKRWLRHQVWERVPPLIRPFFYFTYRFILRGGFIDGRKAFIYHFLQALWFPFLIDVKYIELKQRLKKTKMESN